MAREFGRADGVAVRFAGLDGLRGLAALGVVTLHVWKSTGARRPGSLGLLRAAIGELRLGVVLFFVLSAFLLSGPWVRRALDGGPRVDLRHFAVKRIVRIFPAYWLALAGAFAVIGPGASRALPAALPLYGFIGQHYFPSTAQRLDPPSWSLAVELAFYAALPGIGWLLARAGQRGGFRAVLSVCAWLIAGGLGWNAAAALDGWPRTITVWLPTYLPLFASGIAARVVAHHRPPNRRVVTLPLLVCGWVAVVADGAWHWLDRGIAPQIPGDLLAGAGFAAIVLVVGTRPPGVLALGPLRALGTVSYGLYLWHFPLMSLLASHRLLPGHFPSALALVLSAALPIAALSWRFVERPILAATNRLTIPNASVPAPRTS